MVCGMTSLLSKIRRSVAVSLLSVSAVALMSGCTVDIETTRGTAVAETSVASVADTLIGEEIPAEKSSVSAEEPVEEWTEPVEWTVGTLPSDSIIPTTPPVADLAATCPEGQWPLPAEYNEQYSSTQNPALDGGIVAYDQVPTTVYAADGIEEALNAPCVDSVIIDAMEADALADLQGTSPPSTLTPPRTVVIVLPTVDLDKIMP